MNALLQTELEQRSMSSDDLEAVLAIELQSYSFPWTRGNFVDSLAAGYRAEVLTGRNTGIVAYFVAMAGVAELHLLNLTVAPRWQGRGLGHRLLDVLEQRCREAGAAMLWLEVRSSNQRARSLYLQRGFAEVGLRKGYYPAAGGTREDAVVMSQSVIDGGAIGLQ